MFSRALPKSGTLPEPQTSRRAAGFFPVRCPKQKKGEQHLRVFLGSFRDPSSVGWGGSRALAWRAPARSCTGWTAARPRWPGTCPRRGIAAFPVASCSVSTREGWMAVSCALLASNTWKGVGWIACGTGVWMLGRLRGWLGCYGFFGGCLGVLFGIERGDPSTLSGRLSLRLWP